MYLHVKRKFLKSHVCETNVDDIFQADVRTIVCVAETSSAGSREENVWKGST